MILFPDIETLSRDGLEQLQIERLQSTLFRVYSNVAFYRRQFESCQVDIERVRTLEDLRRLPFTTKEDLRRSYPYDLFAVPLKDVVRLHTTSGTTGRPVAVAYTKNDLRHWTECTARHLAGAGIDENSVAQIAFPYDLFTGGFGFHQGAEMIGASVIPASSSPLEKQVTIMRDYQTTALLCTPACALHLASYLKERRLDPSQGFFLRTGLFGAEPWSEAARRRIEEGLHLAAFDTYGLSEVMGPGVAAECEARQGLHLNEDHLLCEVIDPQTLEPCPPGEVGELVFTTITREAFPLIRYRTGDLSMFLEGGCPCGRTLRRLQRVSGRTDDLIFFEGQKIFPAQIEEVLLEAEGASPHYRVILERQGHRDLLEVQVEVLEGITNIDKMKNLESLRNLITVRLAEVLDVHAKVTLVEPRSLARGAGAKQRRVVDRRDQA